MISPTFLTWCSEWLRPAHLDIPDSFKTYVPLPLQRSSLFTNSFMNLDLYVFVEPHFIITNWSYITLEWILVPYHPDDVIVISPSSPPDSDLDDVFFASSRRSPKTTSQHQKHTNTRHTRSLTNIRQWCKLHKKYWKSHQSNLTPTSLHPSPMNIYSKEPWHYKIKIK